MDYKDKIHTHFCTNFFTPGVIKELDNLITIINVYLQTPKTKYPLLTSIITYIKHIFKVGF